jgi:hypothetical protein
MLYDHGLINLITNDYFLFAYFSDVQFIIIAPPALQSPAF